VSNLTRYPLYLLSGALLALAGCQTTPTSPPPAPALQLIQSQPLVLAQDCRANGSFFVEFSVLSDGRTGRIQAPEERNLARYTLDTKSGRSCGV
jgi:hypothetical protein